MKGKIVIQSLFDEEYTFVIEHMVYISDWPQAPMKNPGMNFSAKFSEISNPRNSGLVLKDLPSKCVKLSTFPDKNFSYQSQVNSVEMSQNFTIAPYSTPVLTPLAKYQDNHLFRKGTSFRLHKNVPNTEFYTNHVYC